MYGVQRVAPKCLFSCVALRQWSASDYAAYQTSLEKQGAKVGRGFDDIPG
jgi:hypothetical protein